MFLDERKIPLIVTKCNALIRNLSPNHPKLPLINNEISTRLAGYYGENAIDYHLKKLDKENYDVIPGIRLKLHDRYFQIDTLLLTNRYWLPIEIKNLKGDIEIDSLKGQMTQTYDGIVKVYDDPLAQVQHQRMQLIQWMQEHKLPTIPMDFLVSFSNSNGSIKTVGYSDHYWKVCRGINIFEKIAKFDKIYQTEVITTKERRKLAKILLKNSTPLDIDVFKKFNISPGDFQPGVQCPTCFSSPMFYSFAKWECANCGEKSKTAHFQKVLDYLLIMNPTINNKQFRELTLLQQRATATRILNSMNLKQQGTNKGRIYFPFPEK